ncbi:MAG TPA: glycosyltransferase [Chloroflexota bacterium]|nr:glycosyltransferase [Chloroflexota bacterium]
MVVVCFYHSLVSDWNHGNAHFLRGVVADLLARGHDVRVWEPADGWSRACLLAEIGPSASEAFQQAYPGLESRLYQLDGGGAGGLDLDQALDGADLVLVHEWTDPRLVARIGEARAKGGRFRLLFHDTHHRMVSDPQAMAVYDLQHYDGVLAFGRVLRDLYLSRGFAARAWTWHEAADTTVFRPPANQGPRIGLVWIGNWGDGERSAELREFLLEPVRALNLPATAYGVRFPPEGLAALADAGMRVGGWLPNFRVPEVFARHAATVHVPRRPYVRGLPGIPTIRVFEALACGIPLVCAPWDDSEGLFLPGEDYLVARDGAEMTTHMRTLLAEPDRAAALARHGLATIHARHTCTHRVDELLAIYHELVDSQDGAPTAPDQDERTRTA